MFRRACPCPPPRHRCHDFAGSRPHRRTLRGTDRPSVHAAAIHQERVIRPRNARAENPGRTTLGDLHVLNDVLIRPVPHEAARDERPSEVPATASWTAPALSASGDAVVDLRESIRAKLTYALGRTPETARDRDWFAATALALRDRIVAAALAAERGVAEQARLLPLAGIPDRPADVGRDEQPRPHRHHPGRAPGTRGRSRRRAGGRARCRARQWRPRTAGRLLHGEHGQHRPPGHGLRHPLRSRPVPPVLRGRLAARGAGDLARRGQPLGIPPARGDLRRSASAGASRCPPRSEGGDPAPLAAGRDRAGGGPRRAGGRLARAPRQRPAPVEGRGRRARGPRPVQRRRPCRRGRGADARRGDLPGALSERFLGRGPGAAPAPGILLHLGLAPGSRAPATWPSAATCGPCRTTPRSSSTTPTRRSRCRS